MKGLSKRTLNSLGRYGRSISVEPVALIFGFGMSIFLAGRISSLYYKVCMMQYGHRIGFDCSNKTQMTTEETDTIQEIVSQWSFYDSIAELLSSIPAVLIWSAWSDLNGRKWNLLMSQSGMVFTILLWIGYVWAVHSPLWILPLFDALIGMTGQWPLFNITLFQCLADATVTKQYLVIRNGILMGLIAISGIIGNTVASFTIKSYGYLVTFLVGQACIVISIIFTLFMFKDVKSQSESPMEDDVEPLIVPDSSSSNSPPFAVVNSVISLLRGVYETYTKPREHRRRLFLICSALIYALVNTSNDDFIKTLNIFVFRDPFTFTPSSFSQYNAYYIAVKSVGAVMGALCLKWFFGVWDSGLVLIAVLSQTAQLVTVGLSHADWMIWASAAIGCFTGLVIPSLNAFVARSVSADEVGKALAGLGLASNISSILSALLFTQIYKATLEWFAGFPFLLGGGLTLTASAIACWMHLVARRSIPSDQESIRAVWRNTPNRNVVESEDETEQDSGADRSSFRT